MKSTQETSSKILMKNIDLAQQVLLEIIGQDISFALALRNTFKNGKVQNEDRNVITAVVGCSLRHYILFNELVQKRYGEVSREDFCLISVALSNQLFVKKLDIEATNEYVCNKINLPDLKEFLESFNDVTKLIPEEYESTSAEFLSLRFNVPLWVVKMWLKHYGEHLTFKLLKATSKPTHTVARVNTNLITKENLLSQANEFGDWKVSNIVEYFGKSLSKSDSFANKMVFNISPAIKHLGDKLDIDPIREVALYASCPVEILDELVLRCHDVKIDVLVGNQKSFFYYKNAIERNEMNSASIYECPASAVVTCLSKPVHTVFVIPDNSNFNSLKASPETFLRFQREDMDRVLLEENTALEECAKYVEDGGQLIYIIPTASNKEGHNLVSKFIANHKEFSLVKEKQFFAFDKYQTTMYYALINKECKND